MPILVSKTQLITYRCISAVNVIIWLLLHPSLKSGHNSDILLHMHKHTHTHIHRGMCRCMHMDNVCTGTYLRGETFSTDILKEMFVTEATVVVITQLLFKKCCHGRKRMTNGLGKTNINMLYLYVCFAP